MVGRLVVTPMKLLLEPGNMQQRQEWPEYITFIHSFTDPLSLKTGLDIELVMIEAGLQHAVKSMQYNTTVVEINKTQ
jgi:hypothetical protein